MVTALAMLVIAVIFYGLITDKEFPYWHVLCDVRNAKTLQGEPFNKTIENLYPKIDYGVHWHASAYLESYSQNPQIPLLRFDVFPHKQPGSSMRYYFAFNKKTNELVALDKATAEQFPHCSAWMRTKQFIEPNQMTPDSIKTCVELLWQ